MAPGSSVEDRRRERIAQSLENGKLHYSLGELGKAAACFKRAINACACGMQLRDTVCICKNILDAIEDGNLEDALKKKCICSAKSTRHCYDPHHMNALNYLAAVCEKQEKLDQASIHGQNLITIAPYEAKGYLRLAKVLRLQTEASLAIATYQEGIYIISQKDKYDGSLPTMHQMMTRVKKSIRFDFVQRLPIEISTAIFELAGFRATCRCLRVSTTWKKYLTNTGEMKRLWQVQAFRAWKPKGPIKTQALVKYVAYADKHVTHFSVETCTEFKFDMQKLAVVFQACRTLENLKLRVPCYPSNILPISIRYPQLRRLYLGLGVKATRAFVEAIVQASAETLEELSIFDIDSNNVADGEVMPREWPRMENLKTLRLSAGGRQCQLTLSGLMVNTPNVEEVWFEGLALFFLNEHTGWKNVKKLYLGEGVSIPVIAGGALISPSIRELHLAGGVVLQLCGFSRANHNAYTAWLHGTHPIHSSVNFANLAQLEKLSLRYLGPVGPGYLDSWVKPSMESGTIRELELKNFPFSNFPDDQDGEEITWFTSNKLTHLGITGLTQEVGFAINSAEDWLVDFVARFPSLKGLDIGQELISDATLGTIIKMGVRTIFHRHGRFQDDELVAWAARQGSTIVDGPNFWSVSQHPDRCPPSTRGGW
ncbi:Uu.00g105250.m01.CDS01 [Anthostomella pinea]|uniref:Uu.00g105250.m01.CDS01 n=1 Tax=Anthostomella pinea TaxID=933095 RepID=A0AAI8YDD1_9PEZI|nr:Uu.00g105250.m01.CDS01 [Anthostomella pinea]